jgi:hypothetical protein
MHNIEKSAFRHGQYVGYGLGQTWRIYKDTSSNWWTALSQQSADCMSARTLRELSARLART